MANWSLKVNVNENAMDLRRQDGVGERQRETVQETVDSNPRYSPFALTVLPLPEPSSPSDIPFVC